MDKRTLYYILFAVVVIVVGIVIYNRMTDTKLKRIEEKYESVTLKIVELEERSKIYEQELNERIDKIQQLQSANDRKLQEVKNETYKKYSQMSDSDISDAWDSFMSEVRKRNSERNLSR